MEKIAVAGLGLIGGSYGLALKATGKYEILGYDARPEHLKKALQRGIIDRPLEEKDYRDLKGLILAFPVHAIKEELPVYLDKTGDNTWIFDTGSIKYPIIQSVRNHPRRKNFIASHPIAGTEYSGPEAAFATLFEGKINIICNPEESHPGLLEEVKALHDLLGMQTYFMDAAEHDRHIAYVSHLSHVSAFMLGKTVQDVENNEKNLFLMAGSGFASTVRLAKSSPATWVPVFLENRGILLEVLDRYMDNLKAFKEILHKKDENALKTMLTEINRIGKLIDEIQEKHGKQ